MNDVATAVVEAPVAAPPPLAAPPAENTDSIQPDAPNPIKTTPREPVAEEVKRPSIKEAIKAAESKVNKAETEKAKPAEPVTKEVAKTADAPKLDDKGKPVVEAAKPEPWREAPKRFNAAEKAEWDKAPDSAKQGVHRALQELEKGVETYRKDASEYAELAEYREMAKKANVSMKDALKNYTDLDNALRGNDPASKLAAIETVLRVAKVTPEAYAAFISKLPKPTPEQAGQQNNAVIQGLQKQVAQLTQQLQGVVTKGQDSERTQLETELDNWAADKPMAAQLSGRIADFVDEGLSLDEAYAKAEQEFRETALAAGFIPASEAPATPPAVHNLNGRKSITGAPSAGSFPATQQPSKSVMEAVRKARAQVG